MKHKESNEKMRFLNNTSWMLAQQIYSMILSLVVGSLSARYLGPSNYGLLSYGSSLISLFTMISSLGLTNVIINEMIKRPSKVGSYLGSAFVARFIASCASLIMIYGIIFILEPDNKLWSSNPQSEEFWKLYEEKQNDALFEFCRPYKNSAKMKMDWFIQDHLWMIPKPILRYLLKRKE